MGGKRIDNRAHDLSEDRMKKPSEDRGARKKKLKMRTKDENTEGMSAKDAARMKAWERS